MYNGVLFSLPLPYLPSYVRIELFLELRGPDYLVPSFLALTYSVISPIINGLSVLSFLLFYEMYKYLFLYELDQPQWGDTGGLFFPKAVQHIFVGLYIQQICLAALFFLARDENHHPNALPEGIIMIVLIALTVSLLRRRFPMNGSC